MNPLGKKFTALFLVFSLVLLSGNLYAKKRRGADLIITKKNGGKIEGELIAVKPTSLLLVNTDGKDVSVDVVDIKIIRIVKKSKILLGSGLGFLIGGSIGLVIGGHSPALDDFPPILSGLIISGPFILLGVAIGAMVGEDKTIQLEGMTDSEIQEAMDKLRKKARVRNYK